MGKYTVNENKVLEEQLATLKNQKYCFKSVNLNGKNHTVLVMIAFDELPEGETVGALLDLADQEYEALAHQIEDEVDGLYPEE